MAKSNDQTSNNDTDPQVPAVQPATPEQAPATPADFAGQVETLMNHAYEQSQTVGGHWHDWHIHLQNLWLKVRKHV